MRDRGEAAAGLTSATAKRVAPVGEGMAGSGSSHLGAVIGAVDIGGTKIAVGLFDLAGTLLVHRERPTQPLAGFRAAMERIQRLLQELLTETGLALRGIGVACPGPLDPLRGVLGEVGTLPGWQGGRLAGELGEFFGVPVAVENDADAAALAESAWGAGRGSPSMIYLTFSTGIGGGIVYDDRLFRGARGAHPELGHQVLDTTGPPCYCKANGCWESLASGTALARWFQQQHPERGACTTAEIADLASAGDAAALAAMDRLGDYVGLGLANLVTLFTPDTIVLGGGVMKSHALFLPRAMAVVHRVCTQVPADATRIARAALGSETTLAGAARAWSIRFDDFADAPANPAISLA